MVFCFRLLRFGRTERIVRLDKNPDAIAPCSANCARSFFRNAATDIAPAITRAFTFFACL